MKKIYDQTFPKGSVDDDQLYQHIRELNEFSEKPKDEQGNTDELSYQTLLKKKIRIVVYVEK